MTAGKRGEEKVVCVRKVHTQRFELVQEFQFDACTSAFTIQNTSYFLQPENSTFFFEN